MHIQWSSKQILCKGSHTMIEEQMKKKKIQGELGILARQKKNKK